MWQRPDGSLNADRRTMQPSVAHVHVFVSSTRLDLQPERQAVEAAIHRMRETRYVGMEYFGSRDERTQRASLDEVDRSEVYVGIIAARYGSGITEDEYRRARERELPCFIYFKPDTAIPGEWRETDAAKAAQLATWRKELTWNHTYNEFKNPDDLAAKVTADLHRWLVEEFLEPRLAQGARGEVPRSETEHLLAAIKDLGTINQQLLARLRSRGFVIAKGERSVAAENITGSTIVTGDGNTVVQNRGSGAVAFGPGAVAAGEGGVAVGGDVHGDIGVGRRKPKTPGSGGESGQVSGCDHKG
jgi:hypothetical protein